MNGKKGSHLGNYNQLDIRQVREYHDFAKAKLKILSCQWASASRCTFQAREGNLITNQFLSNPVYKFESETY